jgi:biopolymer transport protein ExbB
MHWYLEFNDLMTRGGPVMWVIFITAWLAIVMLCERAIQMQIWLSQAIKDQKAFDNDVHHTPAARPLRRSSPVNTVLQRLQWHSIKDQDNLSKQINIHLTELMPKLEGVLPTIAVLGTLLPMLGLLGTVVGMIEVFEVIALNGTGNPQEMAHGISQALLTTASGLIIAIPVIFFHHLLVKRLQYLLAVTEQSLLVIYNRDLNGATQTQA